MEASEASFAGSFAGILLKKDQEIQILKEKLLVKTKDYEILKQISVKCFRKSHSTAFYWPKVGVQDDRTGLDY